MKLYNPAPGRPVTSPYGPRTHPITGAKGKMHHGIDYGGSFNVLAAGDGIVDHIGWSPRGGGHVVIIKHASNLYTVYYHGAHKTPLKKGARVKAGDFVYRSGNTGASNGAHLHFETRTSKRWGATKNPEFYLTDESPDTRPENGSSEVVKHNISVNGRLNKTTWKAWQETLKAKYGYRGIVDGKPGRMTWQAVQRSSGSKVDGIPGPNTRMRVQTKLKAIGEYSGRIDGIWARGTISALQRSLNKGTY